MSTPVYAMPLPRDKHTGKQCFAFRWIGQPFSSCDGCGRPYWEHTHMETFRDGRWFRQIIQADQRAAVERKWGNN